MVNRFVQEKKLLLTSDWHWTDKPADEYRFGIVDWLIDHVEEWNVGTVCIMGDLTDAKDRHSARLVHRVVHHIQQLATVCRVLVLKGNHDYIDPTEPFFHFVHTIPGVEYVSEMALFELDNVRVGVMGHQTSLEVIQSTIHSHQDVDIFLMHQTVGGAITSNGYELEGLDSAVFDSIRGEVWSGDIHVPQQVGKVNYCGAPYGIRFGDTYKPRVVVWSAETGGVDFTYPCLKKVVVHAATPDDIWKADVTKGDQVKICVELPREDRHAWSVVSQELREAAEKGGLVVHGVMLLSSGEGREPLRDAWGVDHQTHVQGLFDVFCEREKLPKAVVEAGQELLSEVNGGTGHASGHNTDA